MNITNNDVLKDILTKAVKNGSRILMLNLSGDNLLVTIHPNDKPARVMDYSAPEGYVFNRDSMVETLLGLMNTKLDNGYAHGDAKLGRRKMNIKLVAKDGVYLITIKLAK